MATDADSKEAVRVTADCGLDWTGRREVWASWISDRHAHAHNKGRDGLAASCSGLSIAPVPPEVAAGYVPSPSARRGPEMEHQPLIRAGRDEILRQPVPPAADPHAGDWAGRGFTRPGPAREGSAQYAEGYRLGLADARTGGMTFICGGREAAQRAAGYAAGRQAGQRQLEAEPEAGS